MKRFSYIAAGCAAVLTAATGIVVAAPAFAANYSSPYCYTNLVNKTSTSNYINRSNRLALCNVATSGTTCTISSGKTATRTIDLSFNATRAGVAGTLGISSSTTQTISVSCTSPRMNRGQNFAAHPVGSRYQYQLQSYYWTGYSSQYKGSSGWLYAFNPYANAISCGLV